MLAKRLDAKEFSKGFTCRNLSRFVLGCKHLVSVVDNDGQEENLDGILWNKYRMVRVSPVEIQ
jgi:hypothetical protein